MRQLFLLIPAVLCLVSCKDMGGSQPIDARKFLSGLEGPKVPTVQDTMLESAQNAEKQGDFKQASTIYQQMLEKKPDDNNLILAYAESLRRQGDFDRSISVYDMLLAREPSNLAAKEGKGLALMAKGDFDTPAALFDEVMKADPKRWRTLNALGILFATRNMQNEARQYFQEALKNNPSHPAIMNNIGLSLALDRQFDTSIDTLKQAVLAAPANSLDRKRIDLNLSLVYASAGRLEEAGAIAQSYFTGAVLNNNLGLYAHLAKDDRLAKTYLNMALTDSKVFYEKAWDNLQAIDSVSDSPAPVQPLVVKPQADVDSKPEAKKSPKANEHKSEPKSHAEPAKPKAEAKPDVKTKAEPAADDKIDAIIGDSGEEKKP